MRVVLSFLRERSPFTNSETESRLIRNIETGVIADTNVNVNEAVTIFSYNFITKHIQNICKIDTKHYTKNTKTL